MRLKIIFVSIILILIYTIPLLAQLDTNIYIVQFDTSALGNKTPLFLIHGWNYNGKPAPPIPEVWNNFTAYFQTKDSLKNNFKIYLVCYWSNSLQDSSLAKILRNKIDSINILNPAFLQKKIIIMGHSMGGLISRSMMKQCKFNYGNYAGQNCGERVLRLITLGTPHHGTPIANGPARDAHISFLRLLLLQFVEGTILANLNYYDPNRSDLRWDNYDNLLNYNTYPNEKNLWLFNVMNGDTVYDNKLITYSAKYNYQPIVPPYNSSQIYDLCGQILKLDFGLDNDGIGPVKGSDFELHNPLKRYLFTNYNHSEIASGKNANDTALFGSFKNDLLSAMASQILSLNIKVYLEGFWNGSTQVSDSARIYLANSTTPYAFVDSAVALLSTSGTAILSFTKAGIGNYYIVVRHRNHIETWSAAPMTFGSSTLNYDFTTSAAQAYGSNMNLVGSVWCIISGDVNQDGVVDALDRSACWNDRNLNGYYVSDLNGDGVVDALDRSIAWNNRNRSVQKPVLVVSPNREVLQDKNQINSKGTFDLKLDDSNVKKVRKNK
jgi:triacylglycerol esterase/lipase EstA (alpha/beta hydrolase family)